MKPAWIAVAVVVLTGGVAIGLSTAAIAAGCGSALDAGSTQRIEADGLVLVFVPRPAPVAVGRHFEIDVVVCGAAELLAVDADMPAHRHGMNYRTTVQPQGGGRYQVQGLMFHMPGRWRYRFELNAGGRRVELTREVELR